MSEPSRSLEIERKFDVAVSVGVPDWSGVIACVGDPEVRHLDAIYLDTSDLALGRSGYALRRRTGGPDEGWHLKGPRQGAGRVEWGWPLQSADERGSADEVTVPEAVRAELTRISAAPLRPIARIRNTRVAYALHNANGAMVAEFVDDTVHATDLGTGVVREWREWEVELAYEGEGPAGSADNEELLGALSAAALAAGAREAESDSKLAHALGL